MTSHNEQKMLQSPKRKQIIEAAFQLFKDNGFYATGVDLIMRTAKVSKRTLYKYFPTKNDLIVAVLEHYRTTYKAHIDQLLNNEPGNSRDKLLAIFDDAKHWFNDTNFHGCLAVNAMGEFSGKDQNIEDSCRCFKRWEVDVLLNLTQNLDTQNPDQLAYKLFALLEGMSSIAQVSKKSYPIDMTQMANEIIEAHLS